MILCSLCFLKYVSLCVSSWFGMCYLLTVSWEQRKINSSFAASLYDFTTTLMSTRPFRVFELRLYRENGYYVRVSGFRFCGLGAVW